MAIWLYGYMAIWLYGHVGIWLYGYMGSTDWAQWVIKKKDMKLGRGEVEPRRTWRGEMGN